MAAIDRPQTASILRFPERAVAEASRRFAARVLEVAASTPPVAVTDGWYHEAAVRSEAAPRTRQNPSG